MKVLLAIFCIAFVASSSTGYLHGRKQLGASGAVDAAIYQGIGFKRIGEKNIWLVFNCHDKAEVAWDLDAKKIYPLRENGFITSSAENAASLSTSMVGSIATSAGAGAGATFTLKEVFALANAGGKGSIRNLIAGALGVGTGFYFGHWLATYSVLECDSPEVRSALGQVKTWIAVEQHEYGQAMMYLADLRERAEAGGEMPQEVRKVVDTIDEFKLLDGDKISSSSFFIVSATAGLLKAATPSTPPQPSVSEKIGDYLGWAMLVLFVCGLGFFAFICVEDWRINRSSSRK